MMNLEGGAAPVNASLDVDDVAQDEVFALKHRLDLLEVIQTAYDFSPLSNC